MPSKHESLNSLIQAEENYLNDLNDIDLRLLQLWTKQTESVISDFNDMLQSFQDIIHIHKLFYKELKETNFEEGLHYYLLRLVKFIKIPYQTYNKKYLNNLEQRQDILSNTLIQQFLHDINKDRQGEEKKLQSLLDAPLNHIHFYKSFFNKSDIDVGQPILTQANELFDSLINVMSIDIDSLYNQIDCTHVTDILNDDPISNYKLQPFSKILLCSTFNCAELSKNVQLIVTTDNNLIFCHSKDLDCTGNKYTLLYAPIDINDISIQAVQLQHELVDDYNFQLQIHGRKIFTMKSSHTDYRKWLGIEEESLKGHSVEHWKPFKDIVESYGTDHQNISNKPKQSDLASIRKNDVFRFYTEHSGEVSPLVSSDEEEESESEAEINFRKMKSESSFKSDNYTNKIQILDTDYFPSSSSSTTLKEQKSMPPSLPEKTNISRLPLEFPKRNYQPPIISSVKSPSVCNQSLTSQLIPSNLLSSTTSLPYNSATVRPENTRPLSTTNHQPKDKPLISNQHPHPKQSSSLSSTPSSFPPLSKKKSFVQTVISVISSKASSRLQKSQAKLNEHPEPSTALDVPHENKQTHNTNLQNLNSVVLPSQQQQQQQQQETTKLGPDSTDLLCCQKSENPTKTLIIPQNSTAPCPSLNSYSSNNHSSSSFINVTSLSQTSIALTPPLSQSSSPRSSTPVSLSLHQASSYSSFEELGTPPESPEIITQRNLIRNILYVNDKCIVFRWKDESWYEIEGGCVIEVRQTYNNRSCIAVHIKNTGQLYLNAWVLPDTFICRTNETDLSLSLHITNHQSALETYLFHYETKAEAESFSNLLEQLHNESIKMNTTFSATNTLKSAPPVLIRNSSLTETNTNNNVLTLDELSKTLRLAMQCKCKLYVQSGSSKWRSFGSVHMKVSQQYTSKRMHISIESHKGGKITQLVNAMIQSRNVERLSQKRISFMLVDELQKTSVVYMIQVREELTGDKIIEYIKSKNAEYGW
ncbi:uncharacterized protein BX663DRAFT_482333 [Cokeromyces recurvatus]|uniref:uncharacterized protein n=1 Tax=Cokeromyces recurvatus TaxID=90255 RepID=UPI00221E681C|nr:uncharacterized protein BX663DRAFT_482333 [Cokeromyces recurvatus]KAI7908113.1 hypothetical protein BX663DRAFT_482333 [Cokeromyces recurvatus]